MGPVCFADRQVQDRFLPSCADSRWPGDSARPDLEGYARSANPPISGRRICGGRDHLSEPR